MIYTGLGSFLAIAMCWSCCWQRIDGFLPIPMTPNRLQGNAGSFLGLENGWFVSDNDNDESSGSKDYADDEKPTIVTREMLFRDLLADPQVKRKNKNKQGYRPLDNRDYLPYVVKQITPDPYTKQEIKQSKAQQQKQKHKHKRSDLELIGSRLSVKANDVSTVLGEFQLDKSTTSGDIVCIADRTYKVESARCQYKYAGGQRFVMVRKILEVKEITRALQEAQLEKQLSWTETEFLLGRLKSGKSQDDSNQV